MKSYWAKNSIVMLWSIILLSFSLTDCVKARSSYNMPTTIDSLASYLFFLHGMIVEKRGPHGEHPRHGAYDYHGLVKAFADRGFKVISEMRPGGTNPSIYDAGDQEADTCQRAFEKASKGVASTEIKLSTGLGHGLFYRAREDWLEPVVDWINRKR